MTALLRILILDPLAWVAACIAFGVTVAFAAFGAQSEPQMVGLSVGFATGMTLTAGVFSFLPALVAILLAEAFGWRSVFYWLAVGGGIGLAGHGLTGFLDTPGWGDDRLLAVLGAGFVGGLVYWLIAGRLAGTGGYRNQPPASDQGESR